MLKRLTAIFIILILAMPTLHGSADETANLDEALGELTFNMLTSESSAMVTKDLDLSVPQITDKYPDINIEWNSSDTGIVSVDMKTKKAVLTRPNVNTEVTLTAVLTTGGGLSKEKELVFTVLKYNVSVVVWQPFELPTEKLNQSIDTVGELSEQGWTVANKGSESEYMASVVTDPANPGNHFLKSNRITPNNTGYQVTKLSFSSALKNIVTYKSRMMVERQANTYSDMFIYFNGTNGKLVEIRAEYNLATPRITATQNGSQSVTVLQPNLTLPASGVWFNFEVSFNLSNSSYYIKINDTKSNITYFKPADALVSIDNITNLTMNPFRTLTGASIYIDDVLVTTETPDTSKENSVFCTLNGTKAAIRTSYSSKQDLVQTVDGVIPYGPNQEYALRFGGAALVNKGETNSFLGADTLSSINGESPAFKINGAYLGAEHGQPAGVKVIFALHGKTTADIGSLWQDEAGVNWTLLKVLDKDNLLFISENKGSSAYNYSFYDRVHGALSCVSGAKNTEDIFPVGQVGAQEIIPAANFTEKSFYTVDTSGVRTQITNGQKATGNALEIVEKYDIINPATIADQLRQNRPTDGYKTEPSLADGEVLVSYNVIHRISSDGKMITTTSHEVKTDVSKFNDFSYDALRTVAKDGDAEVMSDFPNREVVYYKNGANTTAMFVNGILPVLDGSEKEILKVNNAFSLIDKSGLPKSNNPSFIPESAFPKGVRDMSISAITYKAYMSPITGVYQINYGESDYLFFDFKTSLSVAKSVALGNREVILVGKSNGADFSLNGSTINVVAVSENDYLVLKLGFSESDYDRAKQFIELYAKDFGVNITDTDYTEHEEGVIRLFLEMVFKSVPQNETDIRNDLLKAMAIPAFNNSTVSKMEEKIIKYGLVLGIDMDQYRNAAERFGAIEISKALYDKNFKSTEEIATAVRNRIKELEDGESKGNSGGNYSGAGSSGGVKISPERTSAPEIPKKIFTDLSNGHWAAKYMTGLVEMGVLEGYENGNIKPDASVSREQFVKMLVLALRIYDDTLTADFADVPKDSWSSTYIASAVSSKIINGYEDKTFLPANNITRQDMAVIVYRAVVEKGIQLEQIAEIGFADENTFADYAVQAVKVLSKAGLINGMDKDHFVPMGYLTRAQAAKIIFELCALS